MNSKVANTKEQMTENVTFTGIYFLIIGFLWQMMWQFQKAGIYPNVYGLSDELFRWIAIGIVVLTVGYLLGYMMYLEIIKKIDAKSLFIKYFIGLSIGLVLSKLLL